MISEAAGLKTMSNDHMMMASQSPVGFPTGNKATIMKVLFGIVALMSQIVVVQGESPVIAANNFAARILQRGYDESQALLLVYGVFISTMPFVLMAADEVLRKRAKVAYVLLLVMTPCAMRYIFYTRMVGMLISIGMLYEICLMFRERNYFEPPPHKILYVLLSLMWVEFPMVIFALGPKHMVEANIEIITMILMSDAYQYIGGKFIPLSEIKPFPTISPNKTLGGYMFAIVSVALVFSQFTQWNLLESVGVIIFGIFGDLIASFVKRDADQKDFGNMLGAHGGVVDRFDGCFMAISLYSLLRWITFA